MITQEDLDNQLREVLLSMEEGEEYILTQTAWDEYNQFRASYGLPELAEEEHQVFGFKVLENELFFDFDCNELILEDISQAKATETVTVMATGMDVAEAAAMAMALLTNQIEKKNKNKSLDGKIAEIDGKKYKLQEVK